MFKFRLFVCDTPYHTVLKYGRVELTGGAKSNMKIGGTLPALLHDIVSGPVYCGL